MNEIEAVGASALLNKAPAGGRSRPWLFALLIAPSAVLMNGVIQGGVLGYMGRQQGISSSRVADIIWLLKNKPKPTDQDIDDAMSGILCRCGTYCRIRKAVHRAAAAVAGGAR